MIETSKKEYSTTIPTTRQEMEEFIEDLFRPEVETEIEIARTNQQIKKSLDVASSVNICPICLEPENLPRCIEC
ncbi:MAG: hypothetical protein LBQ59_04255 [Candidatus Peribacteria bacterium]|jgi:hypothetical protein|nr:hypothetical protein [Candidatus Peribacteria bacterium]